MTHTTRRLIGLCLLLSILAGVWLLLGRATQPVASQSGPEVETVGFGVLDGMTFASQLGPKDKASDVEDVLVFEDGQFLSMECQRRCGYPASPYYVRQLADGGIAFISETHCAEENSTIVWRGIVKDDKITGTYHFSATRWYWTVEGDFWFEGSVTDQPLPLASGE